MLSNAVLKYVETLDSVCAFSVKTVFSHKNSLLACCPHILVSTFTLSFYWKGRYPVVYSAQHVSSCSQMITFQFALWIMYYRFPVYEQSYLQHVRASEHNFHVPTCLCMQIYIKKVSTFIYIYVKMCIFRAMSTGLKMQYPEAVKENGKKYIKNSSCLPNQFNLFVW